MPQAEGPLSITEKKVVVVHVPWPRPAIDNTFWKQRDNQLWGFIQQATKTCQPLDWPYIASALGCTVRDCVQRSQHLYSLRVVTLATELDQVLATDDPSFLEETKDIQSIVNQLPLAKKQQLMDLVQKFKFDWQQISLAWENAKFPAEDCRAIYRQLCTSESAMGLGSGKIGKNENDPLYWKITKFTISFDKKILWKIQLHFLNYKVLC
jgi:hypothetical protein